MNNLRAYIAEFIGTFVLVFISCAAVWTTTLQSYAAGPVVPALAYGFSIVFASYAFGTVSAAQLNPAVSIGLAIAGHQQWSRALVFSAVQVLAGIVATGVLAIILPEQSNSFGGFYFGSTPLVSGFLTEVILTFILVLAVLRVVMTGKAQPVAGLVLGLTAAACVLAGGTISGASMNPARTLGPAIVNLYLVHAPIYVIATLLGGALAAMAERYLTKEA